ncbi:hypothetical protein MKZ38_005485 [Zalerion maritima]|uniref:Transcription factor domain-containing protein n=1 Tax=Zalerion maritima TaxID=339359 RepID=A0AAD5RVZ1_9PEZI|nr:hypothetical protein MKZ38_005485 [Zalerion maritima]
MLLRQGCGTAWHSRCSIGQQRSDIFINPGPESQKLKPRPIMGEGLFAATPFAGDQSNPFAHAHFAAADANLSSRAGLNNGAAFGALDILLYEQPSFSSPNWRISNGCRQFLVSILRTFPRMMMRPDNLPPFVHPLGCGLHYDKQQVWSIDSCAETASAAGFAPLNPLAACASVAHLFASRTVNSEEFLWRTIDGEHRRLLDEMSGFSQGETVAAIQAMVIYTEMRFIASGPDGLRTNKLDFIKTMQKLSERFTQLCPGPFSPSHIREAASRPSWEDWILEETRRRITVCCFLTALVLGGDIRDFMAEPFLLPLPSSKTLWEASLRSREAWEREYDHDGGSCSISGDQLQDGHRQQLRLYTLGDLTLAKQYAGGSSGPAISGSGNMGGNGAIDHALDSWHAGLDRLGMMLAAVLADLVASW